MGNLRYIFLGLLAVWLAYSFFFRDYTPEPDAGWTTEEVAQPTEGVITTMQEISAGEFRIADDTVIADPADSRIIANYLNGTIDTFTLAEAKMMADADTAGNTAVQDTTQRRRGGSSLMRMAMWGYFGYMMGRNMGGPRAGAYLDSRTYNRVNSTAGQRINNSMQRTTTRKPSGKSGYGTGRSTRSYGG